MKKLMIGLVSIFVCVTSFAQSVTLLFRGNQGKNYRVMIDGARYYSSNAVSGSAAYTASYTAANAVGARALTLNDLQPGSHRIEIYSTTNASSSTGGQLVYTNNFQLRRDYDMTITVNGNRITFSEKINPATNANGQYRTAMSAANFQKALTKIRQNRYQDGRIAAIRTTLGSADYFTTDQISQLLTLVNSETARLDLAKTAYSVVADPANYSELNLLFDSQSSRNSLDEYVRVQTVANNQATGTVTNRTLLSTIDYEILIQNLNKNNYQSGKYTIVNNAFSNNSYAFTTTQIRQLLGAISSEPDRLYLAKQSYSTVSDRDNFNTLLTLFTTQANREELNTYIVNNGGTGSNVLVAVRTPMQDVTFTALLRKSSNHIRPTSRYTDVKTAFTDPQNYFSSYQAKQLIALVGSGSTSGILSVSESSKIELAKLAYTRITDPANFSQVIELFENQTSRDEINSYIRVQASY